MDIHLAKLNDLTRGLCHSRARRLYAQANKRGGYVLRCRERGDKRRARILDIHFTAFDIETDTASIKSNVYAWLDREFGTGE